MSLDELKDKHAGSVETASEAFHELCAMVEALEVSIFMIYVTNYSFSKMVIEIISNI